MEILNIRKLAAAAAMFVLLAAQETRGVDAYLKQTGPSPLRIALISAVPVSFRLPESLVERLPHTNATEAATDSTTYEDPDAIAAHPQPTPAATSNPALSTTTDPQISSNPKPPASDLLVVSPQMLTEYFKPVGEGTNSQGTVVVPVPVGFTPPSVTPPSRATYNRP
jgi:hypothetical protein